MAKGKKQGTPLSAEEVHQEVAATTEGEKPKGKLKGEKAEAKKAKGEKKERPSLINLAAKVLAAAKEPMTCKDIVDAVQAKYGWKTKGATPAATLYSAFLREMANEKKPSRFTRPEPGKFALAAADVVASK